MGPESKRDILLAVEREVIGRSSGHRSNYFDMSFDVRKIQKNIYNSDGLTLLPDEVERALEILIKRLVSENSDIFTFIGRFNFDNQITFRVSISSPRPILTKN